MLLALILALGCSTTPESTETPRPDSPGETTPSDTLDTGTTPSTVVEDEELEVTVEATEVPTVLRVRVVTPEPSRAYVRFGREGNLDRQTPESPLGTEHAFLLLGMPAGGEVSFRVHAGALDSEVFVERLPQPDPRLPQLTLAVPAAPSSQVAGNYVLFAGPEAGATGPTATMYVTIINDRGEYVWWKRLPEDRGTSAGMPALDGRSLYWSEVDTHRDDPQGRIVRYALDGTLLSETMVNEPHHVALELADDTFAFLSHTYHDAEGTDYDWFMTDSVVVVPEGGAEADAVEVFSVWDDLFDSSYSTIPREADVCDGHIINVFGRRNICELTHTNSLTFDPIEERFSIMVRWLDAVVTFDRTGEVQWQLGGPWSDFTTTDGEELWESPEETPIWSYPHFSQTWDGGLVMFDNGVNHEDPVSSFVEVAYDEKQGTVREIFRYDERDGGQTISMGDARKLSGGNYLTSWMALQYMAEISPSGQEVWRVESPQPTRRLHLLENLYDLSDIGGAYR